MRSRAEARCEYCRLPEDFAVYPFHVEHIIALKHGGSSEPDNLAWSCFQCNVSKGTDVASYDADTGELTPFFNPRMQVWDEHFELVKGEIVGLTPVGRVTARLLQMNSPEQVAIRRALIAIGEW